MSGAHQQQPQQLRSSRVMICTRSESSMGSPSSADDSPKFFGQHLSEQPGLTGLYLHHQQQQQEKLHTCTTDSELESPLSYSNRNWSIASFAPGQEQHSHKSAAGQSRGSGGSAQGRISPFAAALQQQLDNNQTGQCRYHNADTVDSVAGWAEQHQQQLQEPIKSPVRQAARKHAAAAIKQFADDLDAAGLPNFPIRDLAGQYSSALDQPDTPKHIGEIGGQVNIVCHVGNSSVVKQQHYNHHNAAHSVTEPQKSQEPATTPGSASSDVPEALAALLAIVKDEWEWANVPGRGVRVADLASDAAAQPLMPDSPGVMLEVIEGAAAMRGHGKYAYPSSIDSEGSPAGQLRARYGGSSSRPVSPARSTVQYSSTSNSSRTSPTRGSILSTISSSSSSNTSRATTAYGSSSSYGTPTRSHTNITSYSRYCSPPRGTGQPNRSSSPNMRRSVSPGKTAAGFGSSSSTSRTASPNKSSAAYSTRRTVSPSRGTPAGSTSGRNRSNSPHRTQSPTRGAGLAGQPPAAAASAAASLPCATAAVASSGSRNTSGQRSLQQTHSTVLPRVAESSASAYECVVPQVIHSSRAASKAGNRASGGRTNEGGGRSRSGKPGRSSEVQQISLGGYAHAHAALLQIAQAAPQLIFVPEQQIEASGISEFSCMSNLDGNSETQHHDARRISNRNALESVDFEASLSGSHTAAAVPARADQLTLDKHYLEQQPQQAAVDAAATFDFKLPPPIRTRSNPTHTTVAAAQAACTSFSAAGREPAELPRTSAGGAAATAAAVNSTSRRQTAHQQQPMSRADSTSSTLSTFSKANNTSNSNSGSSISAGGLASASKADQTCQRKQAQQESDSETSVLNPLFSNSNTPKNLSRSGSVPGTGSTSGAEAVPSCTAKSCSTGGTDQRELRHRLSQSTAAAAMAAESGLLNQEASMSSPGAVSWCNEVNGGVQCKEVTSVAAYLAGGNTRVFDTAFCKGPTNTSFTTPTARNPPKQQDAGATWVQRLTGSCAARGSSGSHNSHQTNVSNAGNNNVHTSGGSSASSKASMGSGNGSAASSMGSRSSYANSHSRAISSASQGFTAGLKDRPGRSTGGGAKYKRRLLFVLPLLMLVAALGVGAWAWVSVIKAEEGATVAAAAGGAAVGPMLIFRVVVAVPSLAANQGCGSWFDSSQRIRDYQQLLSSAYGKTLDLQLPDSPVLNITCSGSVVYASSAPTSPIHEAAPLRSIAAVSTSATQAGFMTAVAEPAPATQNTTKTGIHASRSQNRDTAPGRLLLQQFFKAYPATVDVETVFAVSDKFTAANQRADIVEKVVSATAETLNQPLQQFFSVSAVMVKAVELLAADVKSLDLTMSNVRSESQISSTAADGAVAQVQQPTVLTEADNNSSSIALRSEQGQSNQNWIGPQGSTVRLDNASGIHRFADHKSAPTCTFQPTKSNSAADPQGRLWSWLSGVECVFRAPAAGQAVAAGKPKKVDWETAVLCDDVPNEHNSVIDDSGRLWGWQKGASCAFRLYGKGSKPAKPENVARKVPAASFKDMQDHLPSRVSTVWESAPTCTFAPNDSNAVPDTFGRLWGWESNGSCAFTWRSLPN